MSKEQGRWKKNKTRKAGAAKWNEGGADLKRRSHDGEQDSRQKAGGKAGKNIKGGRTRKKRRKLCWLKHLAGTPSANVPRTRLGKKKIKFDWKGEGVWCCATPDDTGRSHDDQKTENTFGGCK